jgi:Asp-tRNA(Asn)/Glu-tRNA(Gln) amidotransferase A subunit family amidase
MTSFTQERAGPMGRSVYDVAVLTDAVAGFDAEDLSTIVAPGNMPTASYASFLDQQGLRGARIGVFRDLFRSGPKHAEGIALIEHAIAQMKEAGAVIVDPVSTGIDLFPLLEDTRTNYYEAQFSYDLYFRRLGPEAAIHDMDELIAKGGELVKPGIVRGYGEFRSLTHHPDFLARRDTQETLKAAVIELMDKYRLDALVHPFKSLPPERHLDENVREKDNPLSSVTGLPALLVPAGYTRVENGPIALEILGRPFAEPTLFKLAYAYEQVSHARKPAPTTPPLPGERFEY